MITVLGPLFYLNVVIVVGAPDTNEIHMCFDTCINYDGGLVTRIQNGSLEITCNAQLATNTLRLLQRFGGFSMLRYPRLVPIIFRLFRSVSIAAWGASVTFGLSLSLSSRWMFCYAIILSPDHLKCISALTVIGSLPYSARRYPQQNYRWHSCLVKHWAPNGQ